MEAHEKVELMGLKRKRANESDGEERHGGSSPEEISSSEHDQISAGREELKQIFNLGSFISGDNLQEEDNVHHLNQWNVNAAIERHDPLEFLTSEFNASEANSLNSLEDVFGFELNASSQLNGGINSYFEGPTYSSNTCFPNHVAMMNETPFPTRQIGHYQTVCLNQYQKPMASLRLFSELNHVFMPLLESRSTAVSPSEIRKHIRKVAEKVSQMEEMTCMQARKDMLEQENVIQSQIENMDSGVELIQSLLSCAEAVACRDTRQASSLLSKVRLLSSPYGNSLQRVAACFVEGLSTRLENFTSPFPAIASIPSASSEMQKQEGFNLMYEACPYVSFGHFAANEVIMEAFEGEEAVHVIDLGMESGLQWMSLMQSLATSPNGPPALVRITGVSLSVGKMKEAEKQLERVAEGLKLKMEFKAVVQPLESVEKSMLALREGEAVVVNSVLQLHKVVKESRGSLNAVLQSIHGFSPKVLTLVEQDASHNGPFFLGRFTEALHYYSAIFDSLDTIMPRYSTQRVKIEQFHYANEIKNIVACEGPYRVERHERVDQWKRRMSRAGFHPSPLNLLAKARGWLSRNYECDGYTLAEEKGCLLIGWRGKPIIAASSWRC